MNIDTAWKPYLTPTKKYYYCGNLNHIVCKYPVRLDIQQLTAEKQEELIEDLNVLKNIEVTQQLESIELNDFSKDPNQ